MMNNDQFFNNNNNFNQNNQTNNNLFEGQFNNVNQNNTLQDTPPELVEIKNLNEAATASAPTMDVLGPMNIMPDELLPKPVDPIAAYESGNINLNNPVLNSNMQPPLENINNEVNANFGVNNGQPTFETNFNNVEITNNLPSQNNSPLFNNSDINLNNNIMNQDNIIPSQPSEENSSLINNNYINNPLYEAKPEISSAAQPVDFNTNLVNETNPLDISSALNSFANITSPLETNIGIQEKELEKPENTYEINNEVNLEEKTPDYDIIQDTSVSDDLTLDINDLGLEEIEEENDIMDVDIAENNNDNTLNTIDNNKAIEKIKSLIEELKQQGLKIDIEEFDFESMYQIIVKLNK